MTTEATQVNPVKVLLGPNAPVSTLLDSVQKDGKITLKQVPRLALVIRIRGIVGVCPRKRRILENLRLPRLFSSTLVRLDQTSKGMLNYVDDFLAWGYVDKPTLSLLLEKRGSLRVAGKRFPLNRKVDEQIQLVFKKQKISSLAELVERLWQVDRSFSTINRKLWAFTLGAPVKGLGQKKKHFVEGGAYGNREELINGLVEKMI